MEEGKGGGGGEGTEQTHELEIYTNVFCGGVRLQHSCIFIIVL